MVFVRAESLRDGNVFGFHFASLPSPVELTYCLSSSSLTGHIRKLLRQTHEKQIIHSTTEINWSEMFQLLQME